jgi:hypothetical protein
VTDDFTAEQTGWAVELLGKPMHELTRWEQKKIVQYRGKDGAELKASVNLLMGMNELEVAQRKLRAIEKADKLRRMIDKMYKDRDDLRENEEAQSEYDEDGEAADRSTREHVKYDAEGNKQFHKNPQGKQKILTMMAKEIGKLEKTYHDILDQIATMPGGNNTTFIGKQSNTQINLTPDAVAAELADLQD